MEDKATPIEILVHKAETYAKTNIDLLKLQSVDKLSDIAGLVVAKFIFVLLILMVSILASFGLALWLGDVLGASYYGFFAVAFFYVILAVIVYASKKGIQAPVKNAVIKEILEEKQTL